MSYLQLILRLVHVLSGLLWAGTVAFLHFFLAPALDEIGPDGAKVMPALQRRGLATLVPLMALGTLLSGFWLYARAAGGDFGSYLASPPGVTLALSAGAALAAYAVGMLVTRRAMMQAATLMQSLPSAPSAEERDQRIAAARGLRDRGNSAGRFVAILLLLAAAGMAVARYL